MTYYKLVRKTRNGELISQFIDPDDARYQCLSYIPGEKVEAPEFSEGIFLYPSMEGVLGYVDGNTAIGWEGEILCYKACAEGASIYHSTYITAIAVMLELHPAYTFNLFIKDGIRHVEILKV